MKELVITVRGDAYEYLPVVRDRMGFRWLINDLIKVDCYSIIVIFKCGQHPMQHMFALENNCATKSWTNIYNAIDTFTLRIQT